MKKRIISFILAAIMMLGVFAFVSCNKSEDIEHDHDHPADSTENSDKTENTSDNKDNTSSSETNASAEFEVYNIAEEIIYKHDLSILPIVKVSYSELLPDTNSLKVIAKDGNNIIYSYLLLSQTCRTMLTDAKAEIPTSAWLMINYEKNILHGYFYDPLTEANDSAYDYFSAEVPTNSSSAREIIFYRVPKN